ncbi:retrovirus-related pol polyprotein from transposon TNT 1-94 [Tanacetum coccineum]|uniref:Retrovirus-related pol polyprotein from transposon TNT 1-94 n=1 Tax=Tanacetum coccineum TaxID=301880 RepID=A0ABQ5HTK9_9ASTR
MDVKSAFLNGFINKEVYVAQPLRFIDFEKLDHVYKLKKALYGLKQAPKSWYDRLKAFLIKHEYKMGMVDNTLFTKKKSSNLIIVQIYVDDIIFGSTCQDMCDEFAKIIHDEFEMSMMGELNFFLGLQIKQMEDGIFFNQSKYIKEMLKKFGLEDSKPMKTPMSFDTKLTKDEECESVDSTKYRGMIGSLLYLTTSRPDIMFSVCLCARFQEAPKTSHLEAVKRIFRYSKGITHLGLWYPKGIGIETVVYADSDHAGDYVERKSTSGICTFIGCCLTSWFSKKQTALAISTTKAEYVSARKACQQALWMKQALIDYDKGLCTRRGRHSTSSSTAFDQPSSSHLNDDDDDENEEGTSRVSTPSPTRFVNSLTNDFPQVFQNPPNIDPDMEPFYTCQTEIINHQVQLRDEHRGGLRSIKKGLKNLWRNMKKNHPSLDITLSLSPFTPLDHILDTPSPPSPPEPQPPIMGQPLYYNYHDYHGSTCICCSHNRNLFLTLRDEMNILFAHLEYLLTTAITSHFPPQP